MSIFKVIPPKSRKSVFSIDKTKKVRYGLVLYRLGIKSSKQNKILVELATQITFKLNALCEKNDKSFDALEAFKLTKISFDPQIMLLITMPRWDLKLFKLSQDSKGEWRCKAAKPSNKRETRMFEEKQKCIWELEKKYDASARWKAEQLLKNQQSILKDHSKE